MHLSTNNTAGAEVVSFHDNCAPHESKSSDRMGEAVAYEADLLRLPPLKPVGEKYHVDVAVSRGADGFDVERMVSRNPIRVLAPKLPQASVLENKKPPVSLYTSSFGGGLVGGDHVNMRLDIKDRATCLFGTQASTKIFKADATYKAAEDTWNDWNAAYQAGAIQRLEAEVGQDATLIVAPDQVSPFKDSLYFQDQVFRLKRSSALMVIDWITSGRLAHGECWDLDRLYSRNAIEIDRRIELVDAIELSREDQLTDAFRLGYFHCYATMILAGDQLKEMADMISSEIYEHRIHKGQTHELLSSISPWGVSRSCGSIVRILGKDVEQIRDQLSRWMNAIESMTGLHPWARKW